MPLFFARSASNRKLILWQNCQIVKRVTTMITDRVAKDFSDFSDFVVDSLISSYIIGADRPGVPARLTPALCRRTERA